MKHTPEPWHCNEVHVDYGHILIGGPKDWIADIRTEPDDEGTPESNEVEAQANAERIIACVNACAGIAQPIAAIETAKVAIQQASAELLAELEEAPQAIGLRRALSDLNAAAALFGMEPKAAPVPADPEGEE